MLTVDFDKLEFKPGFRVLDAGCGTGRHITEAGQITDAGRLGAQASCVRDFSCVRDAA